MLRAQVCLLRGDFLERQKTVDDERYLKKKALVRYGKITIRKINDITINNYM